MEKRKPNKVVEWKNVDASLALTSVHGDRFGPVTKMIGLASSLNKVDGPNWPSLKQLMRIGLIKRGNPVYDSFEEFVAVQTLCHLVEQVDKEFFCDCRLGIKGKLCAHSMGLV